MNFFQKCVRFLTDRLFRFEILAGRGFYAHLSDEAFIRAKWRVFYGKGKRLHLDKPRSLCEKIQWLKLYDRKPQYTRMVDKCEAKKYVAERVGEEHLIPTLGVWDHASEIDFHALPDRFVLKPTHDSGGLVVCRDKGSLDIRKARRRLEKRLRHNYYLKNREWAYQDVKPRIIAEPLVEELGHPDSREYKTTCMNGKVVFVTICSGIAHAEFEKRFNDHYDRHFRKLDWYVNYKPAPVPPEKPPEWEELIAFCEKLAEGIPYLRVDSYIINGKILFGEMTFYTWGGFMHFHPEAWDRKLGKLLVLPGEAAP